MQIKQIKIISKDVGDLIEQSRQYQAGLYPAASVHQEDPQDLVATDVYFIGVSQNQVIIGLGAVKAIDDAPPYGEIKNLFVDPEHRGQGISRMIMHALEQYLGDCGIDVCRLETGINQPESIALYTSLGYIRCKPYGDYQEDPLSIFMQKDLTCP